MERQRSAMVALVALLSAACSGAASIEPDPKQVSEAFAAAYNAAGYVDPSPARDPGSRRR